MESGLFWQILGDEWFKTTDFSICFVLASGVEGLPQELGKFLSLPFQSGDKNEGKVLL